MKKKGRQPRKYNSRFSIGLFKCRSGNRFGDFFSTKRHFCSKWHLMDHLLTSVSHMSTKLTFGECKSAKYALFYCIQIENSRSSSRFSSVLVSSLITEKYEYMQLAWIETLVITWNSQVFFNLVSPRCWSISLNCESYTTNNVHISATYRNRI